MYTNSIIAAGAFVAMVAAVPMADSHNHRHIHQHGHQKREYVWVTHTEEIIEVVPITKTVWVEPGETPAAYHAPAAHSAPAYTPPAPVEAPTTSVYVAPAPSSVYVAPSSSAPAYVAPAATSVYVAPAPTTPAYVAPTSSAAAAPTYGSGSGTGAGSLSYGMCSSGTSFTGDLTYYEIGMGACGWTNTTDQPVLAIAESIFDSYTTGGNPNNNPLCGKWVTITGADGTPYQIQIVDRCPGCEKGSLDLSLPWFNKITNNADGRAHNMKWTMN